MKEYKSDAGTFAIGLTKKEIKVLCFWACVGIAKSRGGMYEKIAPQMVKYFAKELKYFLPFRPEFNSRIKKYHRNKNKNAQ